MWIEEQVCPQVEQFNRNNVVNNNKCFLSRWIREEKWLKDESGTPQLCGNMVGALEVIFHDHVELLFLGTSIYVYDV